MQTEVPAKSRSLLGVTDLTLLAPIKRGLIPALDARSHESRLRLLFKTLGALRSSSLEAEPTPLITDLIDRIRAIHSFRLAIVGQEPKMLVLSVVFDGGWESYMRRIWRDLGPLLDLIFINCDGYLTSFDHSYAQYAAWVRSVQVDTEFFYNSAGLSVNDLHYLRRAEQVRLGGRVPGAAGSLLDQALPAVTALYRLTDMYPPDPKLVDGDCLKRAARRLLPDLWEGPNPLIAPDVPLPAGRTPTENAALRWIATAQPAAPRPPRPATPDPAQVQGGILVPYANLSHACLLLLELQDAKALQALLEWAKPRIYSAASQPIGGASSMLTNLAFTVQGLELAGVEGATLTELPAEFREGMAARASILGDRRYNHPTRWTLPPRNWPTPAPSGLARVALSSVHAVLHLALSRKGSDTWQDLASDPTHPLRQVVEGLDRTLAGQGVRILSVQSMQRFPDPAAPLGRDPFGFVDGISQPVLAPQPPSTIPSDKVEAGDLLLGYDNSLGDPAQTGRLWNNSTFLVVRKLRLDVQGLDAVIGQCTALPPDEVKSRLMGRWPDGRNLIDKTPGNDFNYEGDAAGIACPIQAHVRRANPRTPPAPVPAVPSSPIDIRPRPVPRIIRRGMSYGPPPTPTAPAAERGLVFMAYNASIAEQFEVIQSWLSGGNPSQERSYSALRDPFLGVAEDDDPHRFVLDAAGNSVMLPPADKPLVTLEWGLYLFVPSMDALDELLARARELASLQAESRPGDPQKNEDRRERVRAALAAKGAVLIAMLRRLEQAEGVDAAKARWKIALEDVGARMSGASQAIWAAVRRLHGGVMRTPYGVLVCSRQRVMEVFGDDRLYTATGYADRMNRSFGNIYLGMDDGPDYQRLSTGPNAAIQGVSISEGFVQALGKTYLTVKIFAAAAPPGGEITVDVKDIVDEVLAGLSAYWFGIPDGTLVVSGGWHWVGDVPPTCPGHFHSPSRYMFQPNPGDDAAAVGQRHGKALKTAVRALVDTHRNAATLPTAPLAKAIFESFPPFSPPAAGAQLAIPPAEEKIRSEIGSTLIGVMMGFLPTVDGNLRATLYEWVRDGSLWDLQTAYFAHSGNAFASAKSVLLPPLRRALQLRPVPELTWRIATAAHDLGAVPVVPGDKIVISIVSALQENLLNEDRDIYPLFGGDRGDAPHPTHACPGYKMALGVMLGTLAGLLGSVNLRPTASPMALRLSPLPGLSPAPATSPAPAPGSPPSAA
jgi:deferrochelatase/peroxidase EfeB